MQIKAILCSLAVLASSVSSDDALSLIQTRVHGRAADSEGLHLRETKECKAAKRARRETKQKRQTYSAAFKAAKAALKTARSAHSTSKEADDAALTALTTACPAPEVPQTPDVGCSADLISSNMPKQAYPANWLARGLPYAGVYGIQKILAGDGLAGSAGGKKLGLAVMQPCSVAWTAGNFETGMAGHFSQFGPEKGDSRNWQGAYGHLGEAFKQKENLKSACECRAWAETVMPWPQAAAVTFYGEQKGKICGPGTAYPHGNAGLSCTRCRVWRMMPASDIPWNRGGFSLVLKDEGDFTMTCYLGNPEEWKARVAAQKAEIAPTIIDKCSKDSWSSGKLAANGGYTAIHVGDLTPPDPYVLTVEGRKMCLKWVKADARCANAVGVQLWKNTFKGTCECFLSVRSSSVNHNNREAGPNPDSAICLL